VEATVKTVIRAVAFACAAPKRRCACFYESRRCQLRDPEEHTCLISGADREVHMAGVHLSFQPVPALVLQPVMPGGAVSPRCSACALSSWLSLRNPASFPTPESLLHDFSSLLVFGSEALDSRNISKVFAAPTIRIVWKIFHSGPEAIEFLKRWPFSWPAGAVYLIHHSPGAAGVSHAVVVYDADSLFDDSHKTGMRMMDPQSGYVYRDFVPFFQPSEHYLIGVNEFNSTLSGPQWGTRAPGWQYPS
jgi:hypothetical protein